MKVIDVFACYYEAALVYNDRPRHAASVKLTATSDQGTIRYDASVSFFPHDAPDDFSISYDAIAEQTLYEGKGRRSKKREQALLDALPETIQVLAASLGGNVDLEKPLIEPRLG